MNKILEALGGWCWGHLSGPIGQRSSLTNYSVETILKTPEGGLIVNQKKIE